MFYCKSEHTTARTGSHNRSAGRLTDARPEWEIKEDVPELNTRKSRPCRGAMRQNAHSRGIFGDFVEDSYIEASRRHYGAERADL